MVDKFEFAPVPLLHFGTGKLATLPGAARSFGSRVLLITGARSFHASVHAEKLQEDFRSVLLTVENYRIISEPSPHVIDEAVQAFAEYAPDCVIAIGGGSALDAGKAISAMLPLRSPVKEYLEGVGTNRVHPGVKVPFIAVPTTSGTGSEATKNAVISEIGEAGYKRSLRHTNFVPNLAIVDPLLTVDCPRATTASSGMDAFTQLMESFLSTDANRLTDTLAIEGLTLVSRSLLRTYHQGSDIGARTDMAFAAYLSGITLANAGLGLIHGMASPLGGYFDIPHGVICSRLMAPANKITVRKLRLQNRNPGALKKYAQAGKLFSSAESKSNDYYTDALLAAIDLWTNELNIPSLSHYGVRSAHFDKIVKGTGNKNNPVALERDEMMEILELSL